ncbi:hypothetical protein VHEMI09883 [[Torrubiella] hemipterigena]|uniref:Acyl-CoA dehydrogenase n=1 Tax=[Torrubiella] hemipterigena TaxID=1531966 RepID=A0A0A1TQV4_9HYPO|nr:hypothetical protein VHEMI09883 [[Torrubiella] hemipterigena]
MASKSSVPVPFSDPAWLRGLPSPYYNESHRAWQKTCRNFMEKHVTPYALEWEESGEVPESVFEIFSKSNMLIPNIPAPLPIKLLHSLGIHELPGGLKVEDFDYFHFSIYVNEMRRVGVQGIQSSLITGMAYGLPPLLAYASPELQQRFVPQVIKGEKRMCIAITEPEAGSDVAGITTTAVKSHCGRFYIVNGTKKWITNGLWSHYATTAVRTGGPGPGGLSLLVVPLLDHPGVSMRRLKTTGGSTSGSTYIELDDVKVPVENLIGEEGGGMKMIMRNFNHERLTICLGSARTARVAISAAFAYVLKREAFGKPLMDQAVVRHRLAKCGAEVEELSSWLDEIVYLMSKLDKQQANRELGGVLALAKARSGAILDESSRCAVLLFGGNGLTRSGQGELVEKIYRDIPSARIPGGSEDVMFDLGIRQLVKNYREDLKHAAGSKL